MVKGDIGQIVRFDPLMQYLPPGEGVPGQPMCPCQPRLTTPAFYPPAPPARRMVGVTSRGSWSPPHPLWFWFWFWLC